MMRALNPAHQFSDQIPENFHIDKIKIYSKEPSYANSSRILACSVPGTIVACMRADM